MNKLYFNRHQLTRLRNFSLICLGWFCLHTNALALPFGVYDARTMAMGGVGVATGARNAVFNNPALLTTAEEIHEWSLTLPTVGRQLDDTDELKDNFDNFKRAANVLDATNNLANQNAVQATLDAIDGSQYRKTNNVAFMLAIPSRILSGAVFLNSYEISNVQPIIGGDDLTIPTYNSTLAHRGVRIIENGVSAAKILDAESGWMENMAIGFSAKFLLIKTYGYTEALGTADLDINGATGSNGSQFAIDVGALKEFGVWKVALVAKNILPGKYTYGS
ncbi:MAG: conjugal transfer protein TraF, partial [Gammaproteobacteria bacterium]|nr:conjugal transfer protein TraF [Gammaproteobacteria bacterium]